MQLDYLRALAPAQLRRMLRLVLRVLDATERAEGMVSIDPEQARAAAEQLLKLAGEIRLNTFDDVDPIVNATYPTPHIHWPQASDVRTWSDVKRLMHQGFDLVLDDDNRKHQPLYFLYHGDHRAPGNNYMPQSAIVSADRRGQLPAPTTLTDGTLRYHFDVKASPKPPTNKRRKRNAARL